MNIFFYNVKSDTGKPVTVASVHLKKVLKLGLNKCALTFYNRAEISEFMKNNEMILNQRLILLCIT